MVRGPARRIARRLWTGRSRGVGQRLVRWRPLSQPFAAGIVTLRHLVENGVGQPLMNWDSWRCSGSPTDRTRRRCLNDDVGLEAVGLRECVREMRITGQAGGAVRRGRWRGAVRGRTRPG
jgi:hypothetical protein